MILKNIEDCFVSAHTDEKKGRKHKGLLAIGEDEKKAQDYIKKAKINLELCEFLKERGFDYKIPEEWFYTLYYCALAILAKLGVESRSQRCTALFLKYLREKNLVDYDQEFIERITVYREKDETSDVDAREKARYSPSIKSEDILSKYEYVSALCKKAISQCEEIVFSNKKIKIPPEILK